MQAQSGRKPTPTHLRLVNGNPGKRPLPLNEVQPVVEIPQTGMHLNPHAKTFAKDIGPELAKYGLISNLDRPMFEMLCQAYGRWKQAELKMQAIAKESKGDGLLIKTPSGYPVMSPYLIIANKAMEQLKVLLAEFGMSPSARARVTPSSQMPLFPDLNQDGDDKPKGFATFQ